MAALDDGLEWPVELSELPQALVGVAGLDTLNNAVHRVIWEALANSGRKDKSSLHFKLLGPVHEFPPMKPKRTSYEWYMPKGVLKRNWIKKHLKEVPAVVVIFYDLDWDDLEWPEKKIECTSRVQSIRSSLEGRNNRLAVVLIQGKAVLPATEDVTAVERAAALCAAADINQKCLFVLPHDDHLQGYILRLDNAFLEMAQSYYQQEIRHIKSHREFLNKTTHQYLFVRHQFKMGFLSELKQDNRNAHVHYSASYSNLLELRINNTNSLEVKTVAGFILYKVCRLLFALNQPRDAIGQFRSHVEHFRNKLGPPEVLFQHYAWLAKQYCVFGELFEEAIHGGLPAVQTMHPGYYYEQAARHTVERKATALLLCQGVDKYPANDPLAGVSAMEFYGQRSWRAGCLSAQPPDSSREMEGFVALQYNERHSTKHSAIIISLLGNAITQFKTYRCPRMRRQLAIQMADEYYSSKDYGKALTLFKHMLWDYRAEGWDGVVTSLVTKALSCAYLTASAKEYIDLALEAMTHVTTAHQHQIWDNLVAIVEGEVPQPEPGTGQQEVQLAKRLWASSRLPTQSPPHVVDMTAFSPCVQCKARLTQKGCHDVEIQVFIRSQLVKAAQFTRLSVCVNNQSASSEFAMCEPGSDALMFGPGEIKSFRCETTPNPADAGKEIQIGSVLLELSSTHGQNVVLRFTGNDGLKQTHPELKHFRYHLSPEKADFEHLVPVVSLTLAQPAARMKMSVNHEAMALQGAWHRIEVTLVNHEPGPVTLATLHVAIKPTPDDPTIEQKTDMCESVEAGLLSLPLSLAVGEMAPGESLVKTFYLRPHTLATRYLNIFVTYTTSQREQRAQSVEDSIAVLKAVEVNFSFLSMRCEPITKIFAREPFFVLCQVDCLVLAPCQITIQRTELQLSGEATLLQPSYECQLSKSTLKEGEGGSCIACLSVNDAVDHPFSLGNFIVHWNRYYSAPMSTYVDMHKLGWITIQPRCPHMWTMTSKEEKVVKMDCDEPGSAVAALPALPAEPSPLRLEVRLPAHGWVRTPLDIVYTIHNQTSSLITLSLNMEPSEAFMFAGNKQIKVSVLPESDHQFEYNLYPLLSGLVALPQLKLAVAPEIASHQLVSDLVERTVPSHVYIMPQSKKRQQEILPDKPDENQT